MHLYMQTQTPTTNARHIYMHSHTFAHHNLWLAYLISRCIKSPTSVTPTYVATNTVRALIFPSMSAHLMILGLILWFDPAINVNHVSTAQGCEPLREIGNGGRGRGWVGGAGQEEGWWISNAIELPHLRAFYYINMFLDNSISSPNIT